MNIDVKRGKIIKTLLELSNYDSEIVKAIQNGENLASYLKDFAVIHPNEYEDLLGQNVNTLGDVLKSLGDFQEMLRIKQQYYKLYGDYTYYFLAACVTGYDKLSYEVCYGPIYNTVEVDGKIDYAPYLKNIGIELPDVITPKSKLEQTSNYVKTIGKIEK